LAHAVLAAVLTIRQNRDEAGSVSRFADDSFSSGVASATKALPYGFSLPDGTLRVFTS
jgi:hypothetical protein